MPTILNNVTLGELGVMLGGFAAIIALLRKTVPWLRNVVHFVDDITGQSARGGVAARPGLLERQAELEAAVADIRGAVQQLRPNGGASVKDQLNRMDVMTDKITNQLDDVKITTRALQIAYDQHVNHSGTAELELRSALAELQHKAFK